MLSPLIRYRRARPCQPLAKYATALIAGPIRGEATIVPEAITVDMAPTTIVAAATTVARAFTPAIATAIIAITIPEAIIPAISTAAPTAITAGVPTITALTGHITTTEDA